jgi:two-component system, chemotaxis family, sensor kinase Cph1
MVSTMPAPKPADPAVPRTDSELSKFLLRACHDLRGPVHAIQAHAELLARKNASLDEPSVQSLGFILSSAAAAGALVDGLTDYSLALEIDASSFRPTPMEVMLRASLAKMSREIREKDAKVTYDSLPVVPGDADRLMQLLEYLLDYALRHPTSDPLRIHISAEPLDDAWLFTVRDNGAGMEAEFAERVFTPFARVQGNERPGPGLATCRAIVERHGGTIRVESHPGGGSVFSFTLPAD